MSTPLSYGEISRDALIGNFHMFRSFLGGDTKIAAVVKANAYGHGLQEVASTLDALVDYFQVDDIEELGALRKVSKKPALVFGYVQKSDLEDLVDLDGVPTLYETDRLQVLEEIGVRRNRIISVHVKIDAELGRQGLLLEAFGEFLKEAKRMLHVRVEGIYAHFSNIEDTGNQTHARRQIKLYQNALRIAEQEGCNNVIRHISATSGILVYEPELKNDMVRLGIGLYGMWPSELLKKHYASETIHLAPVMRWVTHVAQVKEIPRGFPVGYGLTYVAKESMRIAAIPQGYGDGYDRRLSNSGEVLIRGMRCPVIGRVMMNMCVANVTCVPEIRAEDEVVLLGKQGNEEITAEEIAEQIGTINYEITTRISPLLPKIIT